MKDKKRSAKIKKGLEIGAVAVGSIALGSFVWGPLGVAAPFVYGFWRLERWVKRQESNALQRRGYSDWDDLRKKND